MASGPYKDMNYDQVVPWFERVDGTLLEYRVSVIQLLSNMAQLTEKCSTSGDQSDLLTLYRNGVSEAFTYFNKTLLLYNETVEQELQVSDQWLYILLVIIFVIIGGFLCFIAIPVLLRINRIRARYWKVVGDVMLQVGALYKSQCVDRLCAVHGNEIEDGFFARIRQKMKQHPKYKIHRT
jgi:hypothetical protein